MPGTEKAPSCTFHAPPVAAAAARGVAAGAGGATRTGGVPNWVWALLFLSFCFGLFFANFVMVIFIGSVPFGLLSLIGLGFVAVAESRRRERLAAVDATILGVRQALFDDHRTLLRASFYARMGGVELESVPHLWWLQRRIAELQRAAPASAWARSSPAKAPAAAR